MFPGIAIDVHDVWAESKIYDSLKLYEKGVRNEQLWTVLRRQHAYAELRRVGDTEAMIATGRLGEKRILGLLEKLRQRHGDARRSRSCSTTASG